MQTLRRAAWSVALALLVVAGSATSSSAAPIACVDNSSLSSYIALGSGGCTLGDLFVSNFNYTEVLAAGATPVDPEDVIVRTVLGPNPGLMFEGEWYSTQAGVLQQTLSYLVGDLSSQPRISGVDIEFDAYAGVAINPLASIVMSLCPGEPFQPGSTPICGVPPLGPVLVSTATVSQGGIGLLPIELVGIFTFLNVNAGAGGQAEIDSFTNTFAVPEPATLLLVGLGAGGLLARRRRGRPQASSTR